MKTKSLSVKRANVRQNPLTRTLRAVTGRSKRQRVSASTARSDDFDADSEVDASSRISRVLTIIFIIHVLAIGAIFFHQMHLKNRLAESSGADPSATAASAAPAQNLPQFSTGDSSYVVAHGDNYARIAAAQGVDEADLRRANDNVDIHPGLVVKIPPRRITAVEPPEVADRRNPAPAATPSPNPATDGLVPATDPSARDPQLVRPNIPRAQPVASPSSGRTHTVQAGETIWRIANQYRVDQDALMRANNITDPRRVQVGMKLIIP